MHTCHVLPSHSNSLLLSEGVSMPSRSRSPLSSSSSDRMEPSLRSRVRLMSGATSFFFTFLSPFELEGCVPERGPFLTGDKISRGYCTSKVMCNFLGAVTNQEMKKKQPSRNYVSKCLKMLSNNVS